MKNLIIFIIILMTNLLFADYEENNNYQFQQKDHLYISESNQPSVLMSHKDLIVKMDVNNEREIIYENPQRLAGMNNTRNTLLRLHFNHPDPNFIILNEDYIFCSYFDAIWINSTTAEISVPEGIYKICTNFNIDSLPKLVINTDVNLTSGNVVEIFIDHNEAIYHIELNSTDINNESFDYSEKYYSNFIFHFPNEHFFLNHSGDNHMFISGFSEDIVFVAGELKYDENSIYITQHGPFLEIDSDLSFTNEPADYHQQLLTLEIPANIENPKIGVANTIWCNPDEGFFFYMSQLVYYYLMDCIGNPWNINLYMMNNVYTNTGNTIRIYLGSLEDELFIDNYVIAPLHCFEGNIGSFYNFIPTIVNYLSPDGEQLFFGQSPLYIKAFHKYSSNNLFRPIINFTGYNSELRYYDIYSSTFTLIDSNGNLFAEGEILDLWNINLPPDQYTLIVEDTNFNLKGLAGTGRLTNVFDSTLEMPNPPYINAFQVRNEDDKPVNQLDHNENSSLLISISDIELINDVYEYFPVVTDSVKAFYKDHFEETWSELDIEFIHDYNNIFTWTHGKVFSADLSDLTTIDSVAYDLKICSKDLEENSTEFILEPAFVVGNFNATSVSDNEILNNNSNELSLCNFPNPFNPTTNILFNLPKNSEVEISIYNCKGQKIITLINNHLEQGQHSVTWNGKNENNRLVGSGIYYYELKINDKIIASKKCLLLK